MWSAGFTKLNRLIASNALSITDITIVTSAPSEEDVNHLCPFSQCLPNAQSEAPGEGHNGNCTESGTDLKNSFKIHRSIPYADSATGIAFETHNVCQLVYGVVGRPSIGVAANHRECDSIVFGDVGSGQMYTIAQGTCVHRTIK